MILYLVYLQHAVLIRVNIHLSVSYSQNVIAENKSERFSGSSRYLYRVFYLSCFTVDKFSIGLISHEFHSVGHYSFIAVKTYYIFLIKNCILVFIGFFSRICFPFYFACSSVYPP